MLQDVVNVGTHGRQHVDARQVACGLLEAVVHCVAIDEQDLAVPAIAVELGLERLGLGIAQLEMAAKPVKKSCRLSPLFIFQ